MAFKRIVLVLKKTPLELLLKVRSMGQVEHFLKTRNESIDEYVKTNLIYQTAVDEVRRALPTDIESYELDRDRISKFLFRENDLIIVVGPDGLCINVAKYLNDQPILGVNPDSHRIDGLLVRYSSSIVSQKLAAVLSDQFALDELVLAQVKTNDGQMLYAVNDFLIGRRDQISARYNLSFNNRTERQSSSGILVSTGVGSTGWITSLYTSAKALTGTQSFGGCPVPFGWSDRHLVFVVREGFPSKYTGTNILAGTITARNSLVVTSEMPEGGVIFSDGVIEDAIKFNSGTTATVSVADKTAKLIRLK